VFTKGGLDLIATGSVVKLQPGSDAVASSVGVIDEKTEIGLFANGVIDPSVARAVATIINRRGLHVRAIERGWGRRAPSGTERISLLGWSPSM
jgi:hypothetical protein